MILPKKFFTAVFACMTVFSIIPANTSAGEIYHFTDEEIDSAPVKPELTIDKKIISKEELEANHNQVEISLNVSGADMEYAATGLHICYDNRLTVADSNTGSALSYLSAIISEQKSPDNPEMNEIFITTYSNSCDGRDGTMFRFTFTVPDDAENGDVYPIEIIYKENEKTADIFSNVSNNRDGQLMSAYVFKNGISNGYIAIESEEDTAVTCGDANCDGAVNIADAAAIIQHIGNNDTYALSVSGIENADTNADGQITGEDALIIQEFVAGLYENLPVIE